MQKKHMASLAVYPFLATDCKIQSPTIVLISSRRGKVSQTPPQLRGEAILRGGGLLRNYSIVFSHPVAGSTSFSSRPWRCDSPWRWVPMRDYVKVSHFLCLKLLLFPLLSETPNDSIIAISITLSGSALYTHFIDQSIPPSLPPSTF